MGAKFGTLPRAGARDSARLAQLAGSKASARPLSGGDLARFVYVAFVMDAFARRIVPQDLCGTPWGTR
jgi:hypothetical protein